MGTDIPSDTHCHFQLYGQLKPSSLNEYEMQLLEMEIEDPTGARVPHKAPLGMDAVLLSKNCGLLYQTTQLKGLK
jgi:hypothetical protein